MDFRTFEHRNEMHISTPLANTFTTNGYRMIYPHWHPHYEVTIIYSPIGCELINNSASIRRNGPLVTIHRPYTVHMIRIDEGEYYRTLLRFDSQFISDFPARIVDLSGIAASDFACAYPSEAELSEFRSLAEKIHGFNDKRDFSSAKLLVAGLIHQIILVLDSGRGERFSGGVSYIQEILRMIGENLSEPMTLYELCDKFDVGASKLCKDFRKTTGKTYKSYLTDLRMTRARELLSAGSSIINASLETGYSSEAHFIKAFREYWGMTPGRFVNL